MTIYVSRQTTNDGSNLAEVLRAIMQYQAKGAVVATGLTDSSTGVASGTGLLPASSTAVNIAQSGSNLADKATTEAAMVTVLNALATLYAKANTAATSLGLATITYNGGGTGGGNTVAAVTKVVTGATTGVPATTYNVFTSGANNAVYQLAVLVNKLGAATGYGVVLNTTAFKGTLSSATIAAISTATGTAVAPSVAQTTAQADLTILANNVATLAAAVTSMVSVAAKPGAVAV